MCEIIDRKKASPAKGYWRKNNLPGDSVYWFNIIAAPCQCGQTWWVRPTDRFGWVEATKEDANQA